MQKHCIFDFAEIARNVGFRRADLGNGLAECDEIWRDVTPLLELLLVEILAIFVHGFARNVVRRSRVRRSLNSVADNVGIDRLYVGNGVVKFNEIWRGVALMFELLTVEILLTSVHRFARSVVRRSRVRRR